MLTLGSMFSGGGLADVGCKAAGYTPVFAVEWDAPTADVYADNLGKHVYCAPVEEVDYRPYAGLDLLWASPCCTNASVAKTDGKEEEQDLTAAAAVIRALREIRPRAFVLENVAGYAKFSAFGRIVQGLWDLGYGVEWDVFNAADFGVPQTRKRLILRALRDQRWVPGLTPTHSERLPHPDQGCLFGEGGVALPWVGWYEAIADLIPELPESKFAPWQLERLPECFSNHLLVHPTADCDWFVTRAGNEPAFTSGVGQGVPRAFLVDGDNAGKNGPIAHNQQRPAPTVSLQSRPRALLVNGQNAGRDLTLADAAAPSFAVTNAAKAVPRALLVSNAKTEWSDGTRTADTPAFAATQEQGGRLRALLEQGRVVSMTARALARFQSVPDTYRLPTKTALAYRVVGNGVPSLFARRIAESLGLVVPACGGRG